MEATKITRRQFTREATVLASLSHPNLPRVVVTATDTSYPDGSIGLLARTFDLAPAELRFDDLVVTALQ